MTQYLEYLLVAVLVLTPAVGIIASAQRLRTFGQRARLSLAACLAMTIGLLVPIVYSLIPYLRTKPGTIAIWRGPRDVAFSIGLLGVTIGVGLLIKAALLTLPADSTPSSE